MRTIHKGGNLWGKVRIVSQFSLSLYYYPEASFCEEMFP